VISAVICSPCIKYIFISGCALAITTGQKDTKNIITEMKNKKLRCEKQGYITLAIWEYVPAPQLVTDLRGHDLAYLGSEVDNHVPSEEWHKY
jgi:hypothetical protein